MRAGGELRAALYHRFRWLYPLTISPRARRFWRVLGWSLCAVYFAFVALVLALRYSILPNIEHYRGDIERLASQRLGQTVTIGRIESSWQGINPDLTLLDVRIADAEGRPALVLSRVEAVLSWWSVSRLELNLRLLRIEEPTLAPTRRSAAAQPPRPRSRTPRTERSAPRSSPSRPARSHPARSPRAAPDRVRSWLER